MYDESKISNAVMTLINASNEASLPSLVPDLDEGFPKYFLTCPGHEDIPLLPDAHSNQEEILEIL